MLIKSLSRHFVVRALVMVIIQLGFIWAKLAGILNWHWLLIFAPTLLTATIFTIFLFMAMVIMILSD